MNVAYTVKVVSAAAFVAAATHQTLRKHFDKKAQTESK